MDSDQTRCRGPSGHLGRLSPASSKAGVRQVLTSLVRERLICRVRRRLFVYLSDDDSLLGDQVAATIGKMEADPEIAVVYAPWLLFDPVAQPQQGQFYSVPHDLRIERGHHGELLDPILRHHIFPELQITRRDAFQATMPRINDHAFLAFVHSADYLTMGAVLIQKQPFYVAITRYFEEDAREQRARGASVRPSASARQCRRASRARARSGGGRPPCGLGQIEGHVRHVQK